MLQKYHRHMLIYTLGEFQANGAKKVKKRKVLAKERKRKGETDFVFFPKKKAGHNSEPPKQTYY